MTWWMWSRLMWSGIAGMAWGSSVFEIFAISFAAYWVMAMIGAEVQEIVGPPVDEASGAEVVPIGAARRRRKGGAA